MEIEMHNNVFVLRDDLLPGGTKSVFLHSLLDVSKDYFVYASPVYGGMQIALAEYCKSIGKQAVIFCAKRNEPHPNSLKAKAAGATVFQVPFGYLSNCQAKAKAFAKANNAQLIEFGADYPSANIAIANRMREATVAIGGEPDEVWCAVGSGTLLKGIIAGTSSSRVLGVQVGAEFEGNLPSRARVMKYHRPFDKIAQGTAPFPSCGNYDRKAWEYCMKGKGMGKIFFWNVL